VATREIRWIGRGRTGVDKVRMVGITDNDETDFLMDRLRTDLGGRNMTMMLPVMLNVNVTW